MFALPAMKGKMGSNEYYVVAMRAKELVDKALIPKEIEGWDNLSLEERDQRDINYTRVKKHIAPYVAHNPDRFFGSIIVAVEGWEKLVFEPLTELAKGNLGASHKREGETIGFLHFNGGEAIYPLDGQHRIKALKFALEGKDEKSKDIPGLNPCSAVANDQVTVIMISGSDKSRSRRIFTHVNKHAKPTTTGQNLVVDDDDIIAVLSRELTNDLIGAKLVNYKTNTLSDKDGYFITLATIARCTEHILVQVAEKRKIDRKTLPDEGAKKLYKQEAFQTWELLLEEIEKFKMALADKKSLGGVQIRRQLKKDYLLMRPVGFVVLFGAYQRVLHSEPGTETKIINRLNRVNWAFSAPLWENLLWSAGKIQTKNEDLAIRILSHVISDNYPDNPQKLLADYRALFPEAEREGVGLPPKIREGGE